jgi:hypothetical protein
LPRWRSQRIAKCRSCELQDTLALFGLRNTLLTERIRHSAVSLFGYCSALGWVFIAIYRFRIQFLAECLIHRFRTFCFFLASLFFFFFLGVSSFTCIFLCARKK